MVGLALLRLVVVLLGLNLFGQLEGQECGPTSFRLPRHIRPDNYNLFIKPDLDKNTFQGLVKITLHVSNNVQDTQSNLKEIVLHADKELQINDVKFDSEDNNDVSKVKNWCLNTANEQIVIRLDRELKPGSSGRLDIDFVGPIRYDDVGLYFSYHDTVGGKNIFMAVTQFQETHARKAFPSFDEPDFKATFDVTIEHAMGLKALSNMPVIKEDTVSVEGTDCTQVKFATTPIMSTYLLAFTIGQFDHTEPIMSNGMAITVWTPRGLARMGEFLLNDAARVYAKLHDYFDIGQQIEKIDFVCVHNQKNVVTKNWGLVTVKDRYCLTDRERTSSFDLIFVRSVVSSVLAYSWSGSLVSMRWWDELWLDAGPAILVGDTVNRELFKEGDILFSYKQLDNILEFDADATKTHPIRIAAEIVRTDDFISVIKGAAVFSMIRDHIGADKFQMGLRSYLIDNLNRNTEASQLWGALEAASGIRVEEMATSWIDQAGFPLVTVKLAQDAKHLELSQVRFNGESCGKEDNDNNLERQQKWNIPVPLLVSNGQAGQVKEIKRIMNEKTLTIELPDWFNVSERGHWVKLNPNFGGFYRVYYQDESLFGALEKPIRNKLLSPADRYNVISDVMALLRCRKITWEEFNKVLSWYENEDSDAVIGLFLEKTRLISNEKPHDNDFDWKRFFSNYLSNIGGSSAVESDSLMKQGYRIFITELLFGVNNQNKPTDRIAPPSETKTKGKTTYEIKMTVGKMVKKIGNKMMKRKN